MCFDFLTPLRLCVKIILFLLFRWRLARIGRAAIAPGLASGNRWSRKWRTTFPPSGGEIARSGLSVQSSRMMIMSRWRPHLFCTYSSTALRKAGLRARAWSITGSRFGRIAAAVWLGCRRACSASPAPSAKRWFTSTESWPEKQTTIKPLGTNSSVAQVKVKNVELLGFKGKVKWTQDENGLSVVLPETKPCDYAITLKIS